MTTTLGDVLWGLVSRVGMSACGEGWCSRGLGVVTYSLTVQYMLLFLFLLCACCCIFFLGDLFNTAKTQARRSAARYSTRSWKVQVPALREGWDGCSWGLGVVTCSLQVQCMLLFLFLLCACCCVFFLGNLSDIAKTQARRSAGRYSTRPWKVQVPALREGWEGYPWGFRGRDL